MREEVISVGIDIGTSTTQLIFSKLTIENLASNFTVPRISISDKEVIYKSGIYFTPLLSAQEIDGNEVKAIVEKEYKRAGIEPAKVKLGAVIITGETARKNNANVIIEKLSSLAGDFVVATAGPDLEAIVAGKGAGADKISKDSSTTIINLDIGGGTTNIALFNRGELIDTGCLDIGGRLIKIDKDTGRISYIADKLKELAKHKGIDIKERDIFTRDKAQKLVDEMVGLLEESLGLRPRSVSYERILTGRGIEIENAKLIEGITFSGGVADYIYKDDGEEELIYGDIGIILARAIRRSSLFRSFKVYTPQETIRATVVGAGSHSTDISGSTITYTTERLPIKNLPILKLSKKDEKHIAKSLRDKLKWFQLESKLQPLALAFEGERNPSFKEIERLAEEIIQGAEEILNEDMPLIILVENDVAKVLGQTILRLLRLSNKEKPIICLDSIKTENGDYIDIGKPLAMGKVIPVVIKTLVFH